MVSLDKKRKVAQAPPVSYDTSHEIDSGVFSVLGENLTEPIQKIVSVPEWISAAAPVSASIVADSVPLAQSQIALGADVQAVLTSANASSTVSKWFPVQSQVLPVLLADLRRAKPLPPRDVCIAAPTGSGKTLCYVLPIVESLRYRMIRSIRAVVVVPTLSLANQVSDVFTYFSRCCGGIEICNIASENANEKVKCADVLISTPDRLVTYLCDDEGEHGDLSLLRYLVVDEADRVMKNARCDWLSEIEQAVYGSGQRQKPSSRSSYSQLLLCNRPPLQRILLSATLSRDTEQLQRWNLFQPRMFSVATNTTNENANGQQGQPAANVTAQNDVVPSVAFPTELQHLRFDCIASVKPLIVYLILEKHPVMQRVLCFVHSNELTERLSTVVRTLSGGKITVEVLNGNMFGNRRRRTLKRFEMGKARLLVCSDVAARGLDVKAVDAVVNYTSPPSLDAYVHRAGRAARAGRPGIVLTLHDTDTKKPSYESQLGKMTLLDGIVQADIDSRMDDYRTSLKGLKDTVISGKHHLQKERRKNKKQFGSKRQGASKHVRQI